MAANRKLPRVVVVLTLAAATMWAPAETGFAQSQKKRKPAKGASANQAEGRFAIGDFAEADEIATAVLDVEPDDFRALLVRGQVALLENRLEEAGALLRRAVELRPTHREAKSHLVQVFIRSDRFIEAAVLLAAVGEKAEATTLASFDGLVPYERPSRPVVLRFVQADPLPVVMARINQSKPVAFLIDTGRSQVILDEAWAAEMGVETLGVSRGTFGGGQRASIGHGRADRLTLGTMVIQNVPVTLMDTSPFSAVAHGEEIRGVLGTNLLYHFRVTLDYPGGRLVLVPRDTDAGEPEQETPREGAEEIRVPFWLGGDHRIVARGSANGAESRLFLVHTGLAGLAFTCPESTIDEAGIELIPEAAGEGVGGGGPVTIVPFMLRSLTLGAAEREQLPGAFGPFPESLEHATGFRIAGIVSHAFLRPWAVTFDFDTMEIIFTKPAE